VHASDPDGNAFEGILEGFQPAGDAGRPSQDPASQDPAPSGRGTFWLWPPLPDGTTGLTITVSTLWEAATAGVILTGTDGSE
jgi:hypothetical protein